MMKIHKQKPLVLAVALLACSATHPTWAQEGAAMLEEVVVTARKQQEVAQDLPITITALSGAQLNNEVVLDVRDLQAAVPGLQVSTSNQASFPIFAIRGSETQNNVDGAVGVYFGDVPVITTTTVANSFYDIASVEVLKGPQGTQFGANSTGGTISVRPNMPTDEFEGHLKVGYGDYDRQEYEGVMNVPVTDVIKFRFAGDYVKRDGYIDNKSGGGNIPDEFWDEDHYSLRGIMRIETERLTNDIIADYYNANELFYLPIPVLFTDAQGFPGSNPENYGDRVGTPDTVYLAPNLTGLDRPLDTDTKLWGIQNVLNFEINDHWSVRNVTGYRDDKRDASERSGPTSVHTITVLTSDDNDRVVNDLTIKYTGFDDRFRAALGYYYQNDNRNQGVVATAAQNILDQLAGAPITQNIRIWNERENTFKAVYTNAEYDLTERLTISGGYRYNDDEVSLDYTPSGGIGLPDMGSNFQPGDTAACNLLELQYYENVDYEKCTGYRSADFGGQDSWNAAISYQVNDDTLTYAKAGKGYIAGGVNNNLREVPSFDPETQTQYEIGFKSDWELGGRLIRTNIAVYYGEIDDKQIVQNASYDDQQAANGVINAAKETVKGVDADITYLPLDGLTLRLSYSYIDAEFDEFQFPGLGGPDGPSYVPPQDLSNETPARVPENQFNGTVTYELPIDQRYGIVSTTLSSYYTDSTRVRNTDITGIYGPSYITLDDYWLFNASISWEQIFDSNFTAQLWARNIADKEYANSKDAQFNTFGYATTRYGAPRTYGVNVTYYF